MAFSVGPLAARQLRATQQCAALPAHARNAQPSAMLSVDRRSLLAAVALSPLVLDGKALAGTPEVGTYLPPAGIDDLVLFKPSSSKTPAIRAGTVDRNKPYSFALPPSFTERPVANIASGNYCQPKIDREFGIRHPVFCCQQHGMAPAVNTCIESGTMVIAAPLVKMTNMKDAKIADVGDPEGFLNAVGPFITGTYLDQDDVISMESKRLEDGLDYYYYNVYATYGLKGPHTLTACTVKGELALLFCLAATEKQWPASQKKLQQVLTTFRA